MAFYEFSEASEIGANFFLKFILVMSSVKVQKGGGHIHVLYVKKYNCVD